MPYNTSGAGPHLPGMNRDHAASIRKEFGMSNPR
jgi:hypothetical protein